MLGGRAIVLVADRSILVSLEVIDLINTALVYTYTPLSTIAISMDLQRDSQTRLTFAEKQNQVVVRY